MSSIQSVSACPLCQQVSQRIHSRYERTLQDLPWADYSVTLQLKVRKFFCTNKLCQRRIFTERLPEVAIPWARKTLRLIEQLQAIALALGGALGARLGERLGYSSCASTLLNHLQRLPLPNLGTPKVVEVDDFAFRKGHQYGTILVDLEEHQPIALLADPTADTLKRWLEEHPTIEILSRDRSKTYRSAMDQGAPQALQVADRFHLTQNLQETLEKTLRGYQAELKAVEQNHTKRLAAGSADVAIVSAKPKANPASEQKKQPAYQRRVQQQQRIKALHQQQWPQAAIARELGIGVRTVQRYLSLPDLPATPLSRSTLGKGVLDPYKPQLLEWWNAGIRRPRALMVLLRQQGYKGSERTLQRYISRVRESQGLPPVRVRVIDPLPLALDPQSPPLTPRRAAYLILLKPKNQEQQQTELLDRLVKQHSDLAAVVDLAQEFLRLLRGQQAEGFDAWLIKAMSSQFKAFQTFAEGLIDDYAAIKASLTTSVSNGPVEGLNNRLKMLKRQMYGRAGLELLTKRFILSV